MQKEHPLGDMPLMVLSRGPSEKDKSKQAAYDEHRKNQAALVTLSTAGKQVIAERSGHLIPIDEPALVVTAIRDVIVAGRK